MPNPSSSIRLRSSARTNTGQVRENNEDNIHLWTRDEYLLAVVADGMGGAAAGEEASRLAVESIQQGLLQSEEGKPEALITLDDTSITDKLRHAILTANEKIFQRASSSPDLKGMGTTVTLAFVHGTYAVIAHVGDSRAYLVDGEDQGIAQITSDHSFVEALLIAGHITHEQAEEHPMRNVLYRALGQGEDIDVDVYYKRLHVGDRLILCSDGLTRHVKAGEIARVVLDEQEPDVASQKLIDLANARGGEDNVSVIVVQVEGEENLSEQTSSEGIIFMVGGEDDTLILRDRPFSRSSAAGKDDLSDDEAKDPPASPSTTGNAPSSSHEAPLDDRKVDAERVKDDAARTAESELPHGTIYGNGQSTSSPVSSGAPSPHLEGTGEGRDTLMPDQ